MAATWESDVPCKRGHLGPRYISGNYCVACAKANSVKWNRENPEKSKASKAASDRKNQSKRNEAESRRRAIAKAATPSWLTEEHKKEILQIYEYARSKGYHVDHIVPLKGKTVCGLHVPWNLEAIPASENIQKSNKENYFG